MSWPSAAFISLLRFLDVSGTQPSSEVFSAVVEAPTDSLLFVETVAALFLFFLPGRTVFFASRSSFSLQVGEAVCLVAAVLLFCLGLLLGGTTFHFRRHGGGRLRGRGVASGALVCAGVSVRHRTRLSLLRCRGGWWGSCYLSSSSLTLVVEA